MRFVFLITLGVVQFRAVAVADSTTLSLTESSTTPSPTSTQLLTGSEYTCKTGQEKSSIESVTSDKSKASSVTSSAQTKTSSAGHSLTEIVGTASSTGASNTTTTASSTSSILAPSNTTPCNGYPEFCSRKYSNITHVCSHNSAFVAKNNAASNQEFDIIDQLDDGIRMIQGETQLVNGTIYACHTTCDLLNAGTYESELAKVASWIRDNPYDVVSILVGNSNFAEGVTAKDYVDAFQNSGLGPYLYEPEFVPQHRDQWPTLGQMILRGKRVVVFMDYNANQTEVPYILDEYTHMWSTPFSPTNQSFPCTLQSPPGLNETVAREQYMYLANHNLNTEVSLVGFDMLIPNTAEINNTNGMFNQYGQLGAMVSNCTNDWNRPPNFLVVDYYNHGDPRPGSVFEVAAMANNVKYTAECCGRSSNIASSATYNLLMLIAVVFVAVIPATQMG